MSLTTESEHLAAGDRRRLPVTIGWSLLWLGVVAALGVIAYRTIYTSYWWGDDSGDWMIGLSSYIHHGGLYSTTYSQVGPFYYQFWSSIYALTGLPVNPDTGYFMSLSAWIASAVLIGLSICAYTGRWSLGLIGTLAAFVLFQVNSDEPMEPAQIAYVLVGVLALVAGMWPRLQDRGRLIGGVVIGMCCTAAVFTKVNIGALATLAFIFAAAFYWPDLRFRRSIRSVAMAALLMVPALLLVSSLSGGLRFGYVGLFVIVELAILAVLVVLKKVIPVTGALSDSPPFRVRDVLAVVAAAAATTVLIFVVGAFKGTSPGLIVSQGLLGQGDLVKLFGQPTEVPVLAIPLAVISTGCAFGVWRVHESGRGHEFGVDWLWSRPSAVLRALIGIWMLIAICVSEYGGGTWLLMRHSGVVLAVPFVWVALLGPDRKLPPAHRFARTVLVLLGILNCLEVYPVTGTQLWWAAVLLVPVTLLSVGDAVTILERRRTERRPTLRAEVFIMAAAFLWLFLAEVIPMAIQGSVYYDSFKSLGVNGSGMIRQPTGTGAPVRRVTAYLRQHCSTFQGSPGMNSFYFYTQLEPPTGLNTTQWRRLLSSSQQETVVRKLKTIDGLCILESQKVNESWDSRGSHVSSSPLADYIRDNFKPVATFGMYTVEQRRAKPGA